MPLGKGRRTLEKCDEAWEKLLPAERARMLGLLVERVEYEARSGLVQLRFRTNAGH